MNLKFFPQSQICKLYLALLTQIHFRDLLSPSALGFRIEKSEIPHSAAINSL